MKKIIYSESAPKAVGAYNHAIAAGNFVFTSGQIPIDPISGKLVEGGIKIQTRQVLKNLKEVIRAAGTDLSKVVKTTVFIDDINNFVAVNEVYAEYFSVDPPARSAVQVAALPLGAMVEIEMIAFIS